MSETQSSYPFASARVKALEPRLITKEKLGRLIEAKDYDAAMRQLVEFGYGQSVSGSDFEAMIQKELDEADALLLALSPSDVFTQIIRAHRDYYNLKVIIKLFMRGMSLEGIDLLPGNINVETLRRAIAENNYFELPETMKDALAYIDKQFIITTDASIIGVALDRAYAKGVSALVEKMNNPLIRAISRHISILATSLPCCVCVRRVSPGKLLNVLFLKADGLTSALCSMPLRCRMTVFSKPQLKTNIPIYWLQRSMIT